MPATPIEQPIRYPAATFSPLAPLLFQDILNGPVVFSLHKPKDSVIPASVAS